MLTTTTFPLAASRDPLYSWNWPAPNTKAPPGIHTITGSEPLVSGDHTVSVRHASSRTFGSSRPPPTNDLLCGGAGPGPAPADERLALRRERSGLERIAHPSPRL